MVCILTNIFYAICNDNLVCLLSILYPLLSLCTWAWMAKFERVTRTHDFRKQTIHSNSKKHLKNSYMQNYLCSTWNSSNLLVIKIASCVLWRTGNNKYKCHHWYAATVSLLQKQQPWRWPGAHVYHIHWIWKVLKLGNISYLFTYLSNVSIVLLHICGQATICQTLLLILVLFMYSTARKTNS